MLKKILCLTFIAFWVLAPFRSIAEHLFPGKWWYMPEFSEKLNLSDEQKQQLDAMYLDNRRKLIELKSDLKKEKLDLATLVEQEPLNETAAMEAFQKLDSVRSRLSEEKFHYILGVRKILGQEKFQELQASFKMYREKMRQQFHENKD